jgi:hypothetical protein
MALWLGEFLGTRAVGQRIVRDSHRRAAEVERLITNRRADMKRLWDFWVQNNYRLLRVFEDGSIEPAPTLDVASSPGEMNFLAVTNETPVDSI